MKFFQLPFLLLLLSFSGFSQEKNICITIDDLPAVNYGVKDINQQINEGIIATLNKYSIPAIGFVNEGKLYRDGQLVSEQVQLLNMWVENGYELGNHTFSHHDYNKVEADVYFEDIINGEQIIRKLMKDNGMQLKYFRHPYLHTGADSLKATALSDFLSEHNYIVSPVTVANSDYLFAKVYSEAYQAENDSLMVEIGKAYVDYMETMLHDFEEKSELVFNRNITHSLLIHSNLLNAHYLDELASMFIENGYSFVSQEEALKDTAYSTPVTHFTPTGMSWIYRWAYSLGVDKDQMKSKIEFPQFIQDLLED